MLPKSMTIVALVSGLSACAETPLLGPGPDMDAPVPAPVNLGGIPPGRAAVTAGLDDATVAPVGAGDLEDLDDEDTLTDTDEPLAGDDELLDDDELSDDDELLNDDELLDDDGLLETDDGLLEDEGSLEGDDGLLE